MPDDPHPRRLFEEQSAITLEGEVQRVVYAELQSGWTVIRFLDSATQSQITAVGLLAAVQPGERLRMTGVWEQDRKFGRQFRVEAFLALMPNTTIGIARFLGSGLIRGIGPVMAERLVERFGLQTLEVIEDDPNRLTEVAGIGARRAQGIRQAWQRQRGLREVLIFLQSHGVGVGHATRIYRHYGPRAVEVMRTNPFRLAEEVFGFGFRTADQIAMRVGISPDSPDRAAAGVLHALLEAEGEGHVFLPAELLIDRATQLLNLSAASIQAAIEDLVARRRIVVDSGSVGVELAVYRHSLFNAETTLTQHIRRLTQAHAGSVDPDWHRALSQFEVTEVIELSKRQREAVGRSLTESLLVITGGPGTGKTTLIRAVVALMNSQGKRIALTAPTGRAAKRLAETTGHEAKTLHRLLEFEPRTISFKRDRQRPLEADLVIIDETSMLDCALAWHLFEALPIHCRLILVGDVDQLPSVGPGRILGDLIESGVVPVVRLGEVFRQAASSLIVANAHRIRGGLMPYTRSDPDADFFFFERQTPEEILETIEHLLTVRIPRRFDLDPKRDIQVLAPMRRGSVGVEQLNLLLQKLLSSDRPRLEVAAGRFHTGDRVMQIRNDYELEIFNGDIGQVCGISPDGDSLLVDFDERRLQYPVADCDQLVLAYACTIHKSQGSEYPCVIIPLHSQHFVMLQRNLLYTAVTRGSQLVIVVGETKAMAQAVRNNRQQIRYTGLVERLRSASGLPR